MKESMMMMWIFMNIYDCLIRRWNRHGISACNQSGMCTHSPFWKLSRRTRECTNVSPPTQLDEYQLPHHSKCLVKIQIIQLPLPLPLLPLPLPHPLLLLPLPLLLLLNPRENFLPRMLAIERSIDFVRWISIIVASSFFFLLLFQKKYTDVDRFELFVAKKLFPFTHHVPLV